MRVAINYQDGHYSLYDPTTRSFAAGVDPAEWLKANTVVISDKMWEEYQKHCEVEQTWQERIHILDEDR